VVEVTIKFLAGIREDVGMARTTISMPDDAVLSDLESHLRAFGIDPWASDIIVTLNDHGLRQWPPGRNYADGDQVAVFPLIPGG